MPINIGDTFNYQGNYYLDERLNNINTKSDLINWSKPIPEGFEVYVVDEKSWYSYDSSYVSLETGNFKIRESDLSTEISELNQLIIETAANITSDYTELIESTAENLENEFNAKLDLKVDKESGAGLYPDEDRAKLASINIEELEAMIVVGPGTGRYSTVAITDSSNKNTASGDYSHAEGRFTSATQTAAHAEGVKSVASGTSSHAEGQETIASGTNSHAEGYKTISQNTCTHSEGTETKALGIYSHVEGRLSEAIGSISHAEGEETQAIGSGSHAEGKGTISQGTNSHAEGLNTRSNGDYSHAEGQETNSYGENSHAEGLRSEARGTNSHAEGQNTKANAVNSHAEGDNSITSGTWDSNEYLELISSKVPLPITNTLGGVTSHVEGKDNASFGDYSHAGGERSAALHKRTFVHGLGCETSKEDQVLFGTYPITEINDVPIAFAIGDGQGILNFPTYGPDGLILEDPKRSNLFSIDVHGNAYVKSNSPIDDQNLVTKSYVDSAIRTNNINMSGATCKIYYISSSTLGQYGNWYNLSFASNLNPDNYEFLPGSTKFEIPKVTETTEEIDGVTYRVGTFIFLIRKQ